MREPIPKISIYIFCIKINAVEKSEEKISFILYHVYTACNIFSKIKYL